MNPTRRTIPHGVERSVLHCAILCCAVLYEKYPVLFKKTDALRMQTSYTSLFAIVLAHGVPSSSHLTEFQIQIQNPEMEMAILMAPLTIKNTQG